MARSLSFASALTPEQLAERDIAMIVSATSDSLELKLIKAMFVEVRALKAEVAKLVAQPRRDSDELVDTKYIAERFKRSHQYACVLARQIGCIQVGKNLLCRLGDVDLYAVDPKRYEQRPRERNL